MFQSHYDQASSLPKLQWYPPLVIVWRKGIIYIGNIDPIYLPGLVDRMLSQSSEFDQRFVESFGFSSSMAFHFEIKSWLPMPSYGLLFVWLDVGDVCLAVHINPHIKTKVVQITQKFRDTFLVTATASPQLRIVRCAQKSKFQKSVLWLAVRNKLQVKSVRLSASLKT